jgi:hypothetical protein
VLGLVRPGRRTAALGGAVGVLVASAALWGWTSRDQPADDTADPASLGPDPTDTPPEPLRPVLAVPAEPTTIVAADQAGEQAAAASATFFERAPVVVLAPEDDPDAQALAASATVALGAPLLLTPPAASGNGAPEGDRRDAAAGAGAGATAPVSPGTTVTDELARLSPRAVLAVGPSAVDWAHDQDSAGTVVAAAGPPESWRSLDGLPATDAADPVDPVLVLVDRGAAGDSGSVGAAVATARAAGARVVAVTGVDPRADPEAIAALAEEPLPQRVVALGTAFGPRDRLRQRVEVAATGVELPGGGQVLFPARRLVALYGHPGAPVLGALGEQPVDAAVARAQQTAAGYGGLVGEPVVPAFEIITTVASASPGPDGNYSNESEVADLRPWVDAAGRAGVYVVLDLQPGRTDFLTQAQRYEELLAEPHVGLALDPEWRLGPDQRHLAQIGSVTAEEVNAVAAWLAQLTRERRLPQKLLLLHQFQNRMIADRGTVDTSHDELAVLVHADGFGTPGQKLDTWRALRSEPLADSWWGWKNFIDEDRPTFTPEETVAVDPTPWFVSYQ